MDIDAAYFSKLLVEQKPEHLQKIRKAFFAESEWSVAYSWVVEFYREHKELPKLKTFNKKFSDQLGKLPKTNEPISYYAEELRKRALNNEIKTQLKSKTIKEIESEDPDAALATLKHIAAELTHDYTPNSKISAMNLRKTLKIRWDMYKERKELDGILGISTPWESLNEATLGWCEGDCIFFLAKSGVGKTWVALILSDHAQKMHGKNILFVSQEMAPKEMSIRADALGARISGLSFLKGELSKEDESAYKEYLKKHKDPENGWGDFVLLGQRDVSSVLDLEIAIDTYEPDMVIWDSFYLVADKKWDEQARLVSGIKRLAETKMIPIIGTGQFNRLVAGDDIKADQNAAAGTQAVIQDADAVIGLFQTDEMKGANEMLMASLKVRSGIALEAMTINWDLNTMEFEQKAAMPNYQNDDNDSDDDAYDGKFFNGKN